MHSYRRFIATAIFIVSGMIVSGPSAKALDPGCERKRLRPNERLEFSNGQTTVTIEKHNSNSIFDSVDVWIGNDYQGLYQLPTYIDDSDLYVAHRNRNRNGQFRMEENVVYCIPWQLID